ncbi:MAG: purine-nucleoside phosphorylase [Verrucomicrobiota bacterium]
MADISPPEELKSFRPEMGVVLGSGLGSFVEKIAVETVIPYEEVAGLPTSKVPGHEGKLHAGMLSEVPVLVAQGRVHCYEGWSAREVAATIRLFASVGVKTVILTNAAGIVNANFKPGQWMLIRDHLNLARQSPLTGGPHFVDQTDLYSSRHRQILKKIASEQSDLQLAEGVYAWVNGPEYETPAEVRMLRTLGADAVGMSTVPEAIQARALGLEVVGFSCLTNYGAGLTGQPLSHDEVIEVGQYAAESLVSLLGLAIPHLVDSSPNNDTSEPG